MRANHDSRSSIADRRTRAAGLVRVGVIVVAIVGVGGTALAQPGGGDSRAFAQCFGESARTPAVGDDYTLSAAGICVSQQPGFGGVGSVNSGSNHIVLLPWRLLVDASAVSDFRGAIDASGSASTYANLNCTSNDVVFTNIANPSQTGSIAPTMNYTFRSRCTSQGVSNCFSGYPVCYDYYSIVIDGSTRGQGSYQIDPGSGVTAQGGMAGYPNDASLAFRTTLDYSAVLMTPQSVTLGVVASNAVGYCASPPAQVGVSSSLLEVSLPCGTPVFNLPAGFTANSAQLGIVNNIRAGASLSGQPMDAVACAGGSAAFSVTASGGGLMYQWQWRRIGQQQWLDVAAGQNTDGTASFQSVGGLAQQTDVTNYQEGGVGPQGARAEFRCTVTNSCGGVTSDPATLTICYANCDCSTVVPVLNANDFACFLNAYAAGQSYANCDGSTVTPVLNANDFQCFLNAFATGCP